jgi:hypothetical protein
VAEINAYMREQRHIARENQARAEAAERASAFEQVLRASPRNHEPALPKKKDVGVADINAYMREQRRIARENRARAVAAARAFRENARLNDETDIAGINAYMREQGRIARENRAPGREKEIALAEVNAFMREQRHARRANQARAEADLNGLSMDELVVQAEREQMAAVRPRSPEKNRARPENEDPQREKSEVGLAEIKAFMREQRHARRANQARAEADLQGLSMDELVAQAEREQMAAVRSQLEKLEVNALMQEQRQGGGKPEMEVAESGQRCARPDQPAQPAGLLGPAQMKELFQKQREELRLNRERIRKVRGGSHDADLLPAGDPPKRRRGAGECASPRLVAGRSHAEQAAGPPASEGDSRAYQAEAICALLERELGVERLLTLRQAASGGRADAILRACDPALAVLARQFLVLESM